MNADHTPAAPTAAPRDVPAISAVPVTGAVPQTPPDPSDAANAPGQDQTAGAGNTNSSPDVATLTREQLEARVKTLSDNLAAANTESEYFREQWTELKLRDEALGVDALTVNERDLEEKVVQAVKEAYQNEMKRREAIVLLGKLLDTTDQMIQTAPNYDPKVRADYEIACRAAKEYMAGRSGAAIPLASSLSDGRVSDASPELNAVILNLGKNLGVREGMPFLIFRDKTEIATVKVVLARDEVCAAQVEQLAPNMVPKVGDRAVVEAGQ